jgi:uncharacterized protein DUF1097
MSGLVALALSIGGLGAVATWLALGPLAGMVTIWAIFIGWGSFFHNGADTAAVKNTIVCGIFGAVMAGIAFILMGQVSLGDVLTAPVWVGVTVFVLVFASQVPALAVIPTAVYGYAATAAYVLHVGGDPLAADLSNPVIVISLSLVVGAVFGLLSGKLSAILTGGE